MENKNNSLMKEQLANAIIPLINPNLSYSGVEAFLAV